MFTGLIEATGIVKAIRPAGTSRALHVQTSLGADLVDGDSIAVNGVCLTVTSHDADSFEAVVSPETMRVTTLAALSDGSLVNLERPLRLDARLGGHFVLGHVDGVGRVTSIEADGDCYWIDVDLPEALAPYLISKGSIALDGISLTIAMLTASQVKVQIVPFTWAHTSMSTWRPGTAVNAEADVIGKYVARLLGHHANVSERPEVPALIK